MALILARIDAVFLWIVTVPVAVAWVVFPISPCSFVANFDSVDLNVGGALTFSTKGGSSDYSYNLQDFHGDPVNMAAAISIGLARVVVYISLTLTFSEITALYGDLMV